MQSSSKEREHNSRKIIVVELMVYAVLAAAALLNQGVMCNDEVQHRFRSFYGIREFFSTFVSEQIFSKGRALAAIPSTIFLYLGFASPERIVERISAVFAIGLCIFMMFRFIDLLFHNRFLNYIYLVILIGCIPVTFEHAAPNAFVTVYCYPFALLIASWINFIKYLREGELRRIVYTIILLFIPLVSYEIFVTYTPIYLLLAFYESKKEAVSEKLVDAIKKFIPAFCCAVVFLILYIVAGRVFVSTYDGNQIGSFTVLSALKIIRQLSLSSLPGYFLFNAKYQYLYQVYAAQKGSSVVSCMFRNVDIYMVLLLVMAVLLFRHIVKMQSVKKKGIVDAGILFAAAVFIVLPTLPLSISSMYQGNVTSDNFTALPVTFFSYFASCFVLSYSINIMWNKLSKGKVLTYAMLIVILAGIFGVQSMNAAFSAQQKSNYDRMVKIESLIDTELFTNFNGKTIYSEDIYKIYNLLAFMPGYWDQYAQKDGLQIQFTSEKNKDYWSLYDVDDNYFALERDQQVIIVTDKNYNADRFYVTIDDKTYAVNANQELMQADKKCKVYYFILQDAGLQQVGADAGNIDS